MVQSDILMVGERSGLTYRNVSVELVPEMAVLELASYPTADPDDLYDEQSLLLLARDFAHGCFVGFDGDEPVAMGLGLRRHFDFENPLHKVHDIVGDDGVNSGHQPDGPWYYGSGIAVRTDYRRRGIGAELYQLRKGFCRDNGLRGIVAGGVIPGYADHKHKMSADRYIDEVRAGRLYDRTLTFQLENDFDAICALPGYIRDPAVNDTAVLIVWNNPAVAPATGPRS